MAMGRRLRRIKQQQLWVPAGELPKSAGHPFYRRLGELLDEHGFDAFVEGLCEKFYADVMGRPSLTPGIYFRCLFIGYFEGIDSERGIAWRVDDSLSLRRFLAIDLDESPPDHSTISRTRRLIDVETHRAVFAWALRLLAGEGLLQGGTVAIDATTLEANAALRTLVRRDTGEGYEQYLRRLALESGIETPTREQLAKIDKKRKNKASNKDWQHPYDPDARVTKMKDGRTHLAHKAEHAVDLETGAVVAVTLQDADQGDTTTIEQTLTEAAEGLEDAAHEGAHEGAQVEGVREVVADKGYHSNGVLTDLKALEIRSYISEPDHGRRNWKGKEREKTAVYGNRRRIRGERGKGLLRLRGERVERSFAHCYETGGMRRLHLRGRANILKRLLIHVGAFNLSLALRKAAGAGTPRGLADASAASRALRALWEAFGAAWGALGAGLFVWRGRHRTALSVFAPSRPIPPFPIAA
jgi:transposase